MISAKAQVYLPVHNDDPKQRERRPIPNSSYNNRAVNSLSQAQSYWLLNLPIGETERLTRSVAVLKNLTIFKKMLKTEQLGLRLVKPLDKWQRMSRA